MAKKVEQRFKIFTNIKDTGKLVGELKLKKWRVSVIALDDEGEPIVDPKFIENVVFHLHETFGKPPQKRQSSPYILEESGWGSFDLCIAIKFRNEKKSVKNFFHNLDINNVKYTEEVTIVLNNVSQKFYKLLRPEENEDLARIRPVHGGKGIGNGYAGKGLPKPIRDVENTRLKKSISTIPKSIPREARGEIEQVKRKRRPSVAGSSISINTNSKIKSRPESSINGEVSTRSVTSDETVKRKIIRQPNDNELKNKVTKGKSEINIDDLKGNLELRNFYHKASKFVPRALKLPEVDLDVLLPLVSLLNYSQLMRFTEMAEVHGVKKIYNEKEASYELSLETASKMCIVNLFNYCNICLHPKKKRSRE